MSLLDTIRRGNNFTANDEAIASYVLARPEQVAEMGISQLAKEAFVSNAAVGRFCNKLGLDGYRSFCITLAREVEQERGSHVGLNPDTPFLEGATTRDVMSAVAEISKQAIDSARQSISVTSVRKAARLIREARRVALFGNGDTRISLIAFSNLLLKLGIVCVMGDQQGESTGVPYTMGPKDVAIFASYSGKLMDASLYSLERELGIVRRQGSRTVFVTADAAIEEHAGKTDCLVVLPTGESRRKSISNYYSQACIRYALNCIYGEIFARDWQRGIAARDQHASTDAWA